MAKRDIRNITRLLFDAFEYHFVTADSVRNGTAAEHQWTMTSAIFFATTLLTTIGEKGGGFDVVFEVG